MEKSKLQTTFLTSTCHRTYKKCVQIESMALCGHLMKQCHATEEFIIPEPISKTEHTNVASLVFTEEENKVNLRRCKKKKFLDQKVCRHLCSNTLILTSTRTHSITPCESVCFELTRSFNSSGNVCPTEKYCENGCPCPFYNCEKTDKDPKFVPVFDLKKSDYSRKSFSKGKFKKNTLALFSPAKDVETVEIAYSMSQPFVHYECF